MSFVGTLQRRSLSAIGCCKYPGTIVDRTRHCRGGACPYNFTALLQNSCGAFLGKLAGIEVVVIAALLQQLQVPALLDDAAVAHDEDEVCLADGGQAVGDQERRAVAQR